MIMVNRPIGSMSGSREAGAPAGRSNEWQDEVRKYLGAVEHWIGQNPVPSLAASLAFGAVIAWWIKRR
jgi:hypothetical protein